MGWRRWAGVGVGLAVLGGTGVAIGRMTADEPVGEELLIVPRPVERRDLDDVLTISGEVRREETQEINLPVDGKVSSIAVEDGDTVEPGDPLFALDGRTAYAVDGAFAFYRTLDVGSDGPDVRQLERILDAGVPDLVGVRLGRRREPRVEAGGPFLDRHDADRRGQPRVQRPLQAVARDRMAQPARHDLAERVHAGVGAACCLRHRGFPGEGSNGLFERLLHRHAIRLPLPAAEGRSVIFDSELVAGHVPGSYSASAATVHRLLTRQRRRV